MSATVGFVVPVSTEVLREVAFKVFVTNFTMESLHITMQAVEMFLKGVPTEKSLPANITDVISYIHVSFNVQL